MAKKPLMSSDMSAATGAAAAREKVKPKRASGTATKKHTKAKAALPPVAKTPPAIAAQQPVPKMSVLEEVSLNAYLYAEARGFQGGSQHDDWVRAEREVRKRRSESQN